MAQRGGGGGGGGGAPTSVESVTAAPLDRYAASCMPGRLASLCSSPACLSVQHCSLLSLLSLLRQIGPLSTSSGAAGRDVSSSVVEAAGLRGRDRQFASASVGPMPGRLAGF